MSFKSDVSRIISVDGGNKDIKAILGELKNTISFPNVLCPLPEERQNLKDDYFASNEDSQSTHLNNLHFRVRSDMLSEEFNNKVFGAGSLAMKNKKGKMEVPEKTVKATNDQILIMYLLVAALDAINTQKPDWSNVIHYQAILSAFLPIVELKSKNNYRAKFQERLMSKQHEIQFLQMPGFEKTKVYITFTETYINPEGVAAVIDLAISEPTNYHIADPTLMSKKVLVNEIGGGTTEQPIVNKGKLDKDDSDGIRVGTSAYLDEIMKEIAAEYDYEVSSREKLVEYMKDEHKPYHVKVLGVPKPFKNIADRHLMSAAKKVYEEVDYKWKNIDDLDMTLNIGGGSILLKPYLEQVNSHKYPFKFIEDEKLVPFLNARGGWKSAQRKEEKKRQLTVR